MKIFISTGIYPPDIGGPSQYAKGLENSFEDLGNKVSVGYFDIEKKLPTGIRHIFYFFKILPKILSSDLVIILDNFSAALPTLLASKLFGKKTILRTGGDFLWEGYVERTGEQVLFRDFYKTCMNKLSLKEKFIFRIMNWILSNVDALIFSTRWQLNIFLAAYDLDPRKLFIIENFYGEKDKKTTEVNNKIFVASTRKLKWKNQDVLREAFQIVKSQKPEIELDVENVPYGDFIEKIRASYAVILASLGDISPNMILDAIRLNKPFILTRENGLTDRIADIGLFVDPQNVRDISDKILSLSDPKVYAEYKARIENFQFTHSWIEIAQEFLDISKKI